jgi:hypothetical protein
MKYELGEAKYKPDVLKQIVEINLERDKIQNELDNQSEICISKAGQADVPLSKVEIVKLLTGQQEEIQRLLNLVSKYEKILSSNNLMALAK